jgi:hypothetical protein
VKASLVAGAAVRNCASSREPVASRRGGSTRKGKGRGTTIHLGPDFVGLIKDGKVLVDDTAYFRSQAEQRPIWEALRANPHYRKLQEEISSLLHAQGEERARSVGLRVGWLEQFIVGVSAVILREAKEGKR